MKLQCSGLLPSIEVDLPVRDEHGSGLDRTRSGLKTILAGSGLDRTAIFLNWWIRTGSE